MSPTQTCCPPKSGFCFIKPVAHLFRRDSKPLDRCEPKFGLQQNMIYYRGCFTAVYQRVSREADRIVARGKTPLDITDIWLVPGSTKSGFVVTRSWRLAANTIYEVDPSKTPSFDLSILDHNDPLLLGTRPGVVMNERLILCGDKL